MFRFLVSAVAVAGLAFPALAAEKSGDKMSPLEFTLKDIKGSPVELSKYKGKVVLFVNVASKCGLTPQYKGLEALYEKYKDQGLVIIGVPANEFGKQEPGTNEEIEKFCTAKYSVTFPMMSKVVVKGKGIDPLYEYLTSVDTKPAGKGDISWNFEKFLVGKDGKVAARFAPKTAPDDAALVAAIESALK
ncbi:glutathione peroxidase [Zavarzinella formosa]|uniref:glutathione peroxidase n=1 Tax=Zavarzinella formosa TaxID=360055 RepID=UPI000309F4A5|nr:glutathione peroxidase [Zavarzinella formosa]